MPQAERLRHQLFPGFLPLKILKPNNRCQQAILSFWRGLNPHTKGTKKGAELNRVVAQISGKDLFS